MNKSWGLIPKILSGQKTIESRWYKTRRAPWNGILAGDTVYFKNAGEPITAYAKVSQVKQFELKSIQDIKALIDLYADPIGMMQRDPSKWNSIPRYCILVYLEAPSAIKPFNIDKRGFGTGAARLICNDINRIKI